jgi:hypothetical protein
VSFMGDEMIGEIELRETADISIHPTSGDAINILPRSFAILQVLCPN